MELLLIVAFLFFLFSSRCIVISSRKHKFRPLLANNCLSYRLSFACCVITDDKGGSVHDKTITAVP